MVSHQNIVGLLKENFIDMALTTVTITLRSGIAIKNQEVTISKITIFIEMTTNVAVKIVTIAQGLLLDLAFKLD